MTGDKKPRIRWAGVVFGILFALVAGAGLMVTLDSELLLFVQEWAVPVGLSVGPSAGSFALVLGVGAVVTTVAVVALVRRARQQTTVRGDGGDAAVSGK